MKTSSIAAAATGLLSTSYAATVKIETTSCLSASVPYKSFDIELNSAAPVPYGKLTPISLPKTNTNSFFRSAKCLWASHPLRLLRRRSLHRPMPGLPRHRRQCPRLCILHSRAIRQYCYEPCAGEVYLVYLQAQCTRQRKAPEQRHRIHFCYDPVGVFARA